MFCTKCGKEIIGTVCNCSNGSEATSYTNESNLANAISKYELTSCFMWLLIGSLQAFSVILVNGYDLIPAAVAAMVIGIIIAIVHFVRGNKAVEPKIPGVLQKSKGKYDIFSMIVLLIYIIGLIALIIVGGRNLPIGGQDYIYARYIELFTCGSLAICAMVGIFQAYRDLSVEKNAAIKAETEKYPPIPQFKILPIHKNLIAASAVVVLLTVSCGIYTHYLWNERYDIEKYIVYKVENAQLAGYERKIKDGIMLVSDREPIFRVETKENYIYPKLHPEVEKLYCSFIVKDSNTTSNYYIRFTYNTITNSLTVDECSMRVADSPTYDLTAEETDYVLDILFEKIS